MAPALEGPPCPLGPPNLRATAAPQGQADRGQVMGWRPWRPTGLHRHGHVAPGGLQSWGTRLRMGGCLGTGITGGRRGGSRQSLRPRRTWLRGAQLSPPLPTGSLQDPGWVRSLLWPLSQGPCPGTTAWDLSCLFGQARGPWGWQWNPGLVSHAVARSQPGAVTTGSCGVTRAGPAWGTWHLIRVCAGHDTCGSLKHPGWEPGARLEQPSALEPKSSAEMWVTIGGRQLKDGHVK